MKSIFLQLTFIILSVCSFSVNTFAQCNCDPGNIIPAGNGNVTINNNEVKCFTSGTFTGTISIKSGGVLCIAPAATFYPQNFNTFQGKIINHGTLKTGNLNDAKGTIENWGDFLPQQSFSIATGFLLDNYGKVVLNNSINFNGNATIINHWEGRFFINVDFNLNNNSLFQNYGITATSGSNSNFTTNNAAILENYGELRIKNANFNPQGNVLNEGMIYAGNQFNINSSSVIVNNCRLVANNGFQNGSNSFTNNGLVWASNTNPNVSHIQLNSGTFINGATGQVRGTKFTNNSTVRGEGKFYMTDVTTNQGSWMGTNASNPIQFFDVSQTGSQIFDFQNQNPTVTVRPASMIAPDTITYGGICTNQNYRDLYETHGQIPLPINMKYFNGECKDGVVALNWLTTAETAIKGYTVEKSVDGKVFEADGNVNAQGANNQYAYTTFGDDYKYFRLAVQELGFVTYSKTITVTCDQNKETLANAYVNPNPNNGQFSLIFDAESAQTIEIKIVNAQSRVIYAKNLNTTKGRNNLNVELNNTPAGFYVVTVKDRTGKVSHMKFIIE